VNYKIIFLFAFYLVTEGALAQTILKYDKNNPTAKVHHHYVIHATYKRYYNRLPKHPIVGAYGSTGYYNHATKESGKGECSYIYLPTDGLEIGKQYSVKLTVKMDKDYADMPYFQKNFGLATSNYLFKNDWGLWPKQFIPFGKLEASVDQEVSFDFRPMSRTKYIVIGVFQTAEMDDYYLSNLSQHEFRLIELELTKSKNPNAPFHYVGDAFAEEQLKKLLPQPIRCDSIFFESGSSSIKAKYMQQLKAILSTLKTKQDLVHIFAYTDSKGSNNQKLGNERAESVMSTLVSAGLDSNRVIIVNYGESKAAEAIISSDRRVEVYPNYGKLYQKKYIEALQLAQDGEYGKAHKIMHSQWIKLVPPNFAINALFDCWGESDKALRFKSDLNKTIKRKYYRGKALQFRLDSIFLENRKGKNLGAYLSQNHLPSYKGSCHYVYNQKREAEHRAFADAFYKTHGFPSKAKFSKRSNKMIPDIILGSDELDYLEAYLPIFRKECETEKLSWRQYARLSDKIQIIKTGFQRYGTQTYVNKEGSFITNTPIKNLNQLEEYRRQVKLVSLSESQMNQLKISQAQLDTMLIAELNDLYQQDQKHRLELKYLKDKYGEESDQVTEQWKILEKADSLNLSRAEAIIKNQGWPGPKIVGQQGSSTLFLVIQHADLQTQQKYLPMIRKAVSEGKAMASDLAYLEDRIAVAQGQKQIYGTQVQQDQETGDYYVPAILDPKQVIIRILFEEMGDRMEE